MSSNRSQAQQGPENEEIEHLQNRIRALETELDSRLKSRLLTKENVLDAAAQEVFEDLERTLRDPNSLWESDSDSDEEEGTASSKAARSMGSYERSRQEILRYARHKIHSLSSATILVRNDCDTNVDVSDLMGGLTEERPKEVLIETLQSMTFKEVLELACDYFGMTLENNLRLVDERGTWHQLSKLVLEEIRPSRRNYPTLYLQQRKGLDEVVRKCEFAPADDAFFAESLQVVSKTSFIAPVVKSDGATTLANGMGDNVNPTGNMTKRSGMLFKTDPILFSWRRVACDFLLCVVMFVVLGVFLAYGPEYNEASGVTKLISGALVDVSFTNSVTNVTRQSLLQITDTKDLWAWINGPLGQVVSQQFLGDKQTMIFGPVRIRQNRVRSIPCARAISPLVSQPCFPAFTSANELTQPAWQGVPFKPDDPTVQSVSGSFADYGARGFVLDLPTSVAPSDPRCPNMGDMSQCSPNATCWSCWTDKLQTSNFVDSGSRLVLVEFLLYAANANMFIDSIFAFEFGASGFVFVSYEVRYISVETLSHQQRTALIVVISLLLTWIGVQFFQTAAYMYRVWREATRMDARGIAHEPYFIFRIWTSLPSRFTFWNPLIFGLCIAGLVYVNRTTSFPSLIPGVDLASLPFSTVRTVGDLQSGQVMLGVANMAVAVKLASYFEFSHRFFVYIEFLMETLFMLLVAMTIVMCSFAWLFTVNLAGGGFTVSMSFAESFIFVVRLLLNQIRPQEFEQIGQEMWFPLNWVFYASHIVLNLIMVRIAAPMCYYALKARGSAADHVLRTLDQARLFLRQTVAT